MSEVWALLGAVGATALDVALMRPDAADVSGSWWVAGLIALVAALSWMLGNAGLLAINRVRGWGLGLTWLLVSLQMLVAVGLQGLVLRGASWVLLTDPPGLAEVVRILLLSRAPIWLGMLVITPYLGPLVERVLLAWVLVAVWGLMAVAVPEESRGRLLLVVVVAWLAEVLVARALNPAVQAVRRWSWRRLMGRPLVARASQLLEEASPQLLAHVEQPPTPRERA